VGKPLALLSQSRSVKDIIHETIDRTLEGIVFVSGFPPAPDRIKNGRLVVMAAAATLGYEEINNRCKVDTHYVDELVKVVRQSFSSHLLMMIHCPQAEARICSLRKILKEKAITHVVAQYKLQSGCKALITALLAGRSYIFPGDMANVCDFTDTGILADFYMLRMFFVAIYGTKERAVRTPNLRSSHCGGILQN
jgi:Domain of unknown function (DUF6532)